MIEVVFSSRVNLLAFYNELRAGGLATAFDLAAFWLSLIAPGKKSVNHSRTVASMRETRWEQQQNNSNNKKFVFAAIRRRELNSLLVLQVIAFFALTDFFRGNVELTFSFLLVLCFSLHEVYMYAKNETSEQSLFLDAGSFDSLHLSRCRLLTCGCVQNAHKTNRRANPPIRMQKSFIFSSERPKIKSS